MTVEEFYENCKKTGVLDFTMVLDYEGIIYAGEKSTPVLLLKKGNKQVKLTND
jgi:hypothetical protein